MNLSVVRDGTDGGSGDGHRFVRGERFDRLDPGDQKEDGQQKQPATTNDGVDPSRCERSEYEAGNDRGIHGRESIGRPLRPAPSGGPGRSTSDEKWQVEPPAGRLYSRGMGSPTGKPVIAVDVDDVLVPHADHLIGFLNRTFHSNISLDRFFSFEEIVELAGGNERELVEQTRLFLDSIEFTGIGPVAEAVQVIERLKTRYGLVIVTARPLVIEAMTRRWLEEHFPASFDSAHFVNLDWDWGRGHRTSKMEVCRAAGASILIDDSSFQIEEAVANGMQGLLFGDYPWNAHLPEGATRVGDWPEVAKLLL